MQLKRYQERTLGVIKNFFEKAQSMTPPAAYQLVTEDLDVQARLGKLRKYVEVDGNVPKVAVKVPTGGGKTIIAVEAIRVIGEAFGIDYPFVLWFTPSDAITRQTVEALKRTTHPYRQELERVFGNNVRVYGIDEKFTITPSDLDGNVVIVVTTAQAFVHEKKEKYNVYRKNENLADSGHFDGVALEDGMECDPDDSTKPLASFANLIVKEHPLMIVDEAHKFMARLSKETLEGLRPRGVLELSATPTLENNLLYCVKASELYDEQMVKLPIEVLFQRELGSGGAGRDCEAERDCEGGGRGVCSWRWRVFAADCPLSGVEGERRNAGRGTEEVSDRHGKGPGG